MKSTEEDPESNKPPLINYHLSIYYSNNEAQTKRETAKMPINKKNNEEEIERTASKTVSKMNEKCPSPEKESQERSKINKNQQIINHQINFENMFRI